jgi:hypothetical protein
MFFPAMGNGGGVGVASATHPAGPFRQASASFLPGTAGADDPTIFIDGNGEAILCANGQLDCSSGGDYVEVYDGNSAHAPLLGHLTGDVTDDRLQADTFTTTGRDMFVRFVTDEGNYGLTGTTDDPGFWAEWQFIEDGADCMEYSAIPATGIVGHK